MEIRAEKFYLYIMKELGDKKLGRKAYNFLVNTISGELNTRQISLSEARKSLGLTPSFVAELLAAVDSGRVMHHRARTVLQIRASKDYNTRRQGSSELETIIAAHPELTIGCDRNEIMAAVRETITRNPKVIKDLRGTAKKAGKPQAITWICGQVMRSLDGRPDPASLHAAIRDVLVEEKGIAQKVFESWISCQPKEPIG